MPREWPCPPVPFYLSYGNPLLFETYSWKNVFVNTRDSIMCSHTMHKSKWFSLTNSNSSWFSLNLSTKLSEKFLMIWEWFNIQTVSSWRKKSLDGLILDGHFKVWIYKIDRNQNLWWVSDEFDRVAFLKADSFLVWDILHCSPRNCGLPIRHWYFFFPGFEISSVTLICVSWNFGPGAEISPSSLFIG